MNSDPIAQRIRNGYTWLKLNSEQACELKSEQYDEAKWIRHLKMYEQLVDQARAMGIEEQDCLPQVVDDMTHDEVLAEML